MKPAPLKEPVFEDQGSVIKSTSWVDWFSRLFNTTPTIFQGTVAPTSVPEKIGDIFCDIGNNKIYISIGKSSSSDWKVLN